MSTYITKKTQELQERQSSDVNTPGSDAQRAYAYGQASSFRPQSVTCTTEEDSFYD